MDLRSFSQHPSCGLYNELWCNISIFTGYIGTKEAIYDVLDYSKNVWLSIGVIALSIFVVGPFVHFIIFYFIYKVKSAVLYFLFGLSSEKKLKYNNTGAT